MACWRHTARSKRRQNRTRYTAERKSSSSNKVSCLSHIIQNKNLRVSPPHTCSSLRTHKRYYSHIWFEIKHTYMPYTTRAAYWRRASLCGWRAAERLCVWCCGVLLCKAYNARFACNFPEIGVEILGNPLRDDVIILLFNLRSDAPELCKFMYIADAIFVSEHDLPFYAGSNFYLVIARVLRARIQIKTFNQIFPVLIRRRSTSSSSTNCGECARQCKLITWGVIATQNICKYTNQKIMICFESVFFFIADSNIRIW